MLFGRTSANRLSRFVDEIPDRFIEKPKARTSFSSGSSENNLKQLEYIKKLEYSKAGSSLQYSHPQSISQPAVDIFNKGDSIEHKAFGKGVIISIQPMSGDALMEVAFETVGTKRLMKNTAGRQMSKL